MKKLFFLALILGLNFPLIAQELNNYKYVRVPDKFEFQKDENKYRLNGLLAFLLEKQDFEAIYKEPVPAGVSACDILDAEVHNASGLFKSKVYITLTDCNKKTLFTSKTGVSRKKDFRDGFQEALRKAFKSIEKLNHQYIEGPATVVVQAVPAEEKVVPAKKKTEPSEEKMVPSKEEVEKAAEVVPAEIKPLAFNNGGKTYLLKETSSGFDLFEKDSEKQFAKLVKSGRGDAYLYTSENINGNAFFDTSGNLVVEYLSDGQLVSLTYKKL